MTTALRRMRVLALGFGLAAGVAIPRPLAAQRRAAPTYTLEDVLTSLRRGADTLGIATSNPAQDRALDSVSAMLRAADAGPITIDALASIITKQHPTFGDVARWSPQPRTAWAEPWFFDALVRLRRIANAAGSGIGPQLVAKFGAATADHFIAPMDELETKVLRNAQAINAEKLRRYEIKFGPESARLNIAEVIINYLIERPSWSPLAPDDNGPSPVELLTSYSTSGLTASHSLDNKLRAHLVAGAHAGFRYYRFNEKLVAGNALQTFLSPKYFGAGAFFMGSQDRTLISPFENGHRTGGFLDWGAARAGFTVGKDWRIVLGVGKQILPYLF
jgi:hypothetical protein